MNLILWKLIANFKNVHKTGAQSLFRGARCEFKESDAKASVDKCHSRLAPGKVLRIRPRINIIYLVIK